MRSCPVKGTRTERNMPSGLETNMAGSSAENSLNRAVDRMAEQIAAILNGEIHSIWLYGSVVLDDFRLGWSDIDLLVLANRQITEQEAGQLVGLRQTMLESEPDNLYYRSFEGIIADREEYFTGSFSRLVYWGTSGQRITNRYQQDVFSSCELAKYGKSVYGGNDRSIFAEPSAAELRATVQQHYESIRQYAAVTDDRLYSCGWLLDIARCIYTLRHKDIIAKTRAGFWALNEHLFADEQPLKKALEIRQHPMAYKGKDEVKQWLKSLGPTVQQYADVLERELYITDRDRLISRFVAMAKETLGTCLAGIYLHGSAAMGCYQPKKSDLDFLVVVHAALPDAEKRRFMDGLLALDHECPGKGIEMSVVTKDVCNPFVYPTPFLLHYSGMHTEWYRRDPEDYIRQMKGRDRDLAAHFTVIRSRGCCLYGLPIQEVFGEIPEQDYFDSIWNDVSGAEEEIAENPMYLTLNLTRVLAYLREKKVMSKQEGGVWGLKCLPELYHPLIRSALGEYESGNDVPYDRELAKSYAVYMLDRIRQEGFLPEGDRGEGETEK